ncbi:hypothetical protein [Caryophanon latum]|uniref:Lipoprotein n=1 Tax=Caryophanon latum TaxID=33977 RepID=A0A1C0YBK9_9BACL|nr:hypothetical protein [Caryophanon latum]OCS84562.1 hypothetical protein A6K76_15480 [Caryophanon latum]
MKHFIIAIVLGATLVLTACSSKEDSILNIDLSDSETENIEKAKAELSAAEFDTAIEQSDQFSDGATYEAYLLARANLSQEHYKQAQEEEIFSTDITYETYKGIAESFVNIEEFEKEMFDTEVNEEDVVLAYGAYAAKVVQYTTPLLQEN